MKSTMLVVDNKDINCQNISQLFQGDFEITIAKSIVSAIETLAEKKDDISIILFNIDTFSADGVELLKILVQDNALIKIPVILMLEDTSLEEVDKEYIYAISDIIQLPINTNIVKKRINNIVELFYLKNHFEIMIDQQLHDIRLQNKKLYDMNHRIIDKLGSIVEFRNIESGVHIVRIREFTKVILKYVMKYYPEYELTEQKADIIAYASAMHDIGKIAISDTILLKPGKLTAEEFEIIKSHTTKGGEILEHTIPIDDPEYMYYCYNIARSHHEKFDGKGYPDGLKAEEIPIEAQVVSLADVYDSLISERVYKQAYPKDKAKEMILHGECGVFNPKLLNCFRHGIIEFENLANQLV